MPYKPTAYTAKDYSQLKGLTGITNDQMAEHLKLYNGYVNRTNALLEKVAGLVETNVFDSSYQELKRRAGWEFNGMRLHEFYFENLKPGGKGELSEKNNFGKICTEQFGSIQVWKNDFLGVGKMPGIGWAICYMDKASRQLMNMWINEHDVGHPVGCKPILVMDVFEHAWSAYLKPTERPKYLEDFFTNIDWDAVADRTMMKHAKTVEENYAQSKH
jgi:superoxide dismutase, Fe-Mn family